MKKMIHAARLHFEIILNYKLWIECNQRFLQTFRMNLCFFKKLFLPRCLANVYDGE